METTAKIKEDRKEAVHTASRFEEHQCFIQRDTCRRKSQSTDSSLGNLWGNSACLQSTLMTIRGTPQCVISPSLQILCELRMNTFIALSFICLTSEPNNKQQELLCCFYKENARSCYQLIPLTTYHHLNSCFLLMLSHVCKGFMSRPWHHSSSCWEPLDATPQETRGVLHEQRFVLNRNCLWLGALNLARGSMCSSWMVYSLRTMTLVYKS